MTYLYLPSVTRTRDFDTICRFHVFLTGGEHLPRIIPCNVKPARADGRQSNPVATAKFAFFPSGNRGLPGTRHGP